MADVVIYKTGSFLVCFGSIGGLIWWANFLFPCDPLQKSFAVMCLLAAKNKAAC